VFSGGISDTPSALPTGWSLVDGYLIGPGADLANAILANANLAGANLSGADLSDADFSGADVSGATYGNTICPNGSNSDDDGDTCVGQGGGL